MLMLRELKLTKPAEYQIRMNKKQNYIWVRYKCSCEKQASKMLFRVGSSRCIALVLLVYNRDCSAFVSLLLLEEKSIRLFTCVL
ncbi:hypothetical protein T09_8228 [Trichinella sp. T9]|nr:hypothetical protein T09_8228 [Trichinella sp. T9]